jgi:3-isopropylmalate dehydrogenase
MTKNKKLAVLPGDGIGAEVTAAALAVLRECETVDVTEALVGGAAIDATGSALPKETVALAHASDAVFLGAVGGPKWQGPARAEDGILGLRRHLGTYANLRPARYMGLPTPLREDLVRHADILVVRELSAGVYFGEPRGLGESEAFNTWRQTATEVRRLAELAFGLARKRRGRISSIDKANVLEASRLWRRVVTELAREQPDVEVEHLYVDVAAFAVLQAPHRFDVILTDNLFGDILSDELAAVAGSIGVLPSASLGEGTPIFEPVHGSAPDIAGTGVANPMGAILTVAMMLELVFDKPELARAVETAVTATLRELRTPDIGGQATTQQFTDAVCRNLRWSRYAGGEPEPAASKADWGV